jgi:thymidylate kinase
MFLDINPSVSLERIASRGQQIQAHENLAKLTKLRQAYHMVCDALEKDIPVCRLCADHELDTLVQQALSFIKQHFPHGMRDTQAGRS